MNVLQEIFQWSQELPAWQRDALGRLLVKPQLDDASVDDLCALLKAEHGIADPRGRTAKPLSGQQIPVPAKANKQVRLLAIKNLRNVNALAENQCLGIAPVGVTIIYGDNGSGKSGYSRVLKRACRARDGGEVILPNVHHASTTGAVAEGEFEVEVGGTAQDVRWSDRDAAPEELSTIAVFDSRCARAYVDAEGDFSYVPYGLDLLEGLVRLCDKLKGVIQAEQNQLQLQPPVVPGVKANTKVAVLLASLSDKTSVADVERLAVLSDVEASRHSVLTATLKESDPREKAKQLRLSAKRIGAFAEQVKNKLAVVGAATTAELSTLLEENRRATEAAELARVAFINGEHLLPGTGGEAWRLLFEAARKFASESHLEQKFPALSEGSPCPLCQQPLALGAERLVRFDRFVQQDAERNAKLCRDALEKKLKWLKSQDVALHLDEAREEELEALCGGIVARFKDFEVALKTRRDSIVTISSADDLVPQQLVETWPLDELQRICQALNDEAVACDAAADQSARAIIQAEFDELDARLSLTKVKVGVLEAIERYQNGAKLKKCLSSVNTTAISRKTKQLVSERVGGDLAVRLNREFKALGVGNLAVELTSRSDKGRPRYKLTLKSELGNRLSEVFSDGEQRAIAIASFLAEVGMSGGKGGIVFDDPVSSLDHARRELVARRLVAEGRERQVIVFTHDIYFLRCLEDECMFAKVELKSHALCRRELGFGVPEAELPFEGKNAGARVGALKNALQSLRKLHKTGELAEYRKGTIEAYSRLRMSWERAIEEVLLQQVVVRFRKSVETQRLRSVVVEDDDFALVCAAMTKCSNYAAHDRADAIGNADIEPDELEQDISALESWMGTVHERVKVVEKRRKSNAQH